MEQNVILYPVFGLVLLTLIVATRMLVFRFRAVRKDGLSPAYFLLNRGGKPPEYLVKTTQHYDNLFESPVLFYVVVILIFTTHHVDLSYVIAAWLFLLFRVAHAYIHCTYNKLLHRRNVFLLSKLVLYSMWGRFMFQISVA